MKYQQTFTVEIQCSELLTIGDATVSARVGAAVRAALTEFVGGKKSKKNKMNALSVYVTRASQLDLAALTFLKELSEHTSAAVEEIAARKADEAIDRHRDRCPHERNDRYY